MRGHGVAAAFAVFAAGCSSTGAGFGDVDLRRARWVAQDSGTTAILRGVCAVDENVAWASGTRGTVLRTVDGGEHWETIRVEGHPELDFRDVQAHDEDRAWIVSAGTPAVICHTRDGGKSWNVQYGSEAEGVFFDAIDFWDSHSGIAFSDPVDGMFLVLVTDDGATWQQVARDELPEPVEGEAGFAGSGTCLRTFGERRAWIGTGGGAARVLRSEDRGATWAVAVSGLAHGPSSGVFSIAFANELHGVAVGGDYRDQARSEKNAAWSEDGGRSWHVVESMPPSGYRSAAEHVDGTEATYFAVGPSGTDLSTDGGRTWRRVSDEGFHALSCAPGACWAVGSDGRIARLEPRQ